MEHPLLETPLVDPMYVFLRQEHNINVVKSLFHVINIMYVSRQAIKTKTKNILYTKRKHQQHQNHI